MTDRQNQLRNGDEREINLLELLQVLVDHKMFIIKVCCAAFVISLLYSLVVPNIYSATSRILPPQKEGTGGLSSLLGQASGLAGLAAGGLAGGSDLYVGILRSRSVADAVIQRPEIAPGFRGRTLEAARAMLNGAVKVQAGKDGIISISAEDKDPKRSALLANAFVDELGKTTVRLNLSKAGTERHFLEKRLELVKTDLKAAEESLKSFSQNNKVIQVDSQAKASIEGIAHLKAELATKEVQLAVLSSRQTDESPEVKSLQMAVRRLKGELGSLAGGGGGADGIPALGNVPGVGLEYSRRLRELKTQEAIFEQLTKQCEMAKINEAKDSSSFQILDEAVVPVSKVRPSRSLIVVLATVAAFFLALFIVFVRKYFSSMAEDDRKVIEKITKQAFAFRKGDS